MNDEEILKKLHPNVPFNQLSISIKELMKEARASGRKEGIQESCGSPVPPSSKEYQRIWNLAVDAVEAELKKEYGGLLREGERVFLHTHETKMLTDNCEGCVLEEALRRARGGK